MRRWEGTIPHPSKRTLYQSCQCLHLMGMAINRPRMRLRSSITERITSRIEIKSFGTTRISAFSTGTTHARSEAPFPYFRRPHAIPWSVSSAGYKDWIIECPWRTQKSASNSGSIIVCPPMGRRRDTNNSSRKRNICSRR